MMWQYLSSILGARTAREISASFRGGKMVKSMGQPVDFTIFPRAVLAAYVDALQTFETDWCGLHTSLRRDANALRRSMLWASPGLIVVR